MNKKYQVIIIEDDPMVSMINQQYVEKDNRFEVIKSFRNGREAFEYIKKSPPQLVILDVYMPGLDGLELLRKVRIGELPTEVIMVTASNDKKTLDKALKFGVIDYLVKPFTYSRFQESLDKFAAHSAATSNLTTLNQKKIDYVIKSITVQESDLPKGIQKKTLDVITNYMRSHPKNEMTNEAVAEYAGISRVTSRRYMNYLLELGKLTGRFNYKTGGRPCLVYKYSN